MGHTAGSDPVLSLGPDLAPMMSGSVGFRPIMQAPTSDCQMEIEEAEACFNPNPESRIKKLG